MATSLIIDRKAAALAAALVIITAAGCAQSSGGGGTSTKSESVSERSKAEDYDNSEELAALGEQTAKLDGETYEKSLPANDPWANLPRVAWESAQPDAYLWTIHARNVVQTYGSSMLDGTSDVTKFCPKFFSLDQQHRAHFWVYLVSEMTRYESAFKPWSRLKEGSLGVDGVTHETVYSEGLLQLSYGDKLVYPFCNEFNWKVDSKLSRTDRSKTIFDPYKNLTCGIRILEHQVEKKDLIATSSGAYWSVIKPNSKYNKLSSISAATRKLAYCN